MIENDAPADAWMARWLDAVTDASMTQRKVTSIEKHGGLPALTRAATARGIHLVRVTDDKGNDLVAAGRHPFKVLC